MSHTNQLRFHRRQWALSQRQLAELVGLNARSTVSQHERDVRPPSLLVGLSYQFIFDVPLTQLFPKLAREIEDAVANRGAGLDGTIRTGDRWAERRQVLLRRLTNRASDPANA